MSKNLIVAQIEEYIAYKKGLGFQIKIESQELRRFGAYTLEKSYKGHLTSKIAIEWASLNPNYSQWYKSRRLETVRTFAKYICVFDQEAQMPPKGIFGKCHGRTKPYIFSEQEVLFLMKTAAKLFSPDKFRGISISTIIGLLWSTGMRPNEVCALLNRDVDLKAAVIMVRETKFSKSRLVPLHQSTVKALVKYKSFCEKHRKNCDDDHFFLSTGGHEMKLRNLEYAMQVIRAELPSYSGKWNGRPPRLYDLRHTFACHTLLRWLESGLDINHEMVYLSTYLGHVKISDTYWYLSGTPELMDLSSKLFEEYFLQGDNYHEE
jgi:integrase